MVLTFTPAGMELLEETLEPAPNGALTAPDNVDEVAARYVAAAPDLTPSSSDGRGRRPRPLRPLPRNASPWTRSDRAVRDVSAAPASASEARAAAARQASDRHATEVRSRCASATGVG